MMQTMKSSQQVTIGQISKLFDEKFAQIDQRFDKLEKRTEDGFEKVEVREKANFTVLHEIIQELRKDMNHKFSHVDERFDGMQEAIVKMISEAHERQNHRIEKLERNVFPTRI